MADHRAILDALLERAGTTYAEQAGIRLADTPAPLYRLLVLSVLMSTRIRADIAVAAARELAAAGMGTAHKMAAASWQDRVDALGRAHYVRYDESSATRLVDIATAVRDDYGGDLRRLATDDVKGTVRLLKQFKGIGDTGADIFLREIQDVWTWARPYFDKRAVTAARQLGLPTDPDKLGALAPGENAKLAAALVRVSLDDELRGKVTSQP
jgi:endonuclease III